MAEDSLAVVHFGSGLRGTAKTASLVRPDGMVVVTLEDGRVLEAPAAAFDRRDDAAFSLPIALEASADRAETIIPVVAEVLDVARRRVGTGRVRIQKTVHRRQETVDEPLYREEVQVRRVPVDAGNVAGASTEIRHEGHTLIVPVEEEVLVVTREIRVREELHITRRRVEFREPQSVELRREEVTAERSDGPGPMLDSSPAAARR